jgi:hypothetical protein
MEILAIILIGAVPVGWFLILRDLRRRFIPKKINILIYMFSIAGAIIILYMAHLLSMMSLLASRGLMVIYIILSLGLFFMPIIYIFLRIISIIKNKIKTHNKSI